MIDTLINIDTLLKISLLTGFLLVINSIYIIGLYRAAQKGKVLYPFKFIASYLTYIPYVGEYLYEGLIGCLECMSTIHGFCFIFSILNFIGIDIIEIIFSRYIFLFPFYSLSLSVMIQIIQDILEWLQYSKIIKS